MSVIFCSAAAILEMSALCSETVCSSLSILYIISRSVASCDFLFSLAPERAIISWQAMLAAAAMNAAITASCVGAGGLRCENAGGNAFAG